MKKLRRFGVVCTATLTMNRYVLSALLLFIPGIASSIPITGRTAWLDDEMNYDGGIDDMEGKQYFYWFINRDSTAEIPGAGIILYDLSGDSSPEIPVDQSVVRNGSSFKNSMYGIDDKTQSKQSVYSVPKPDMFEMLSAGLIVILIVALGARYRSSRH
jgi:hypothetical protein